MKSISNITDYIKKKLDFICNQVFINKLKSSKRILEILSKEEDGPIYINDNLNTFDPLY
jgi:fructose-1,6-bisphosphatase